MANGTAALSLVESPLSAVVDKPVTEIEVEIGRAVASAAFAVTVVLDGYCSSGVLPPAAKDATATRVAAVATLALDHAAGDDDFYSRARHLGRRELLCTLRDAGFFQAHSQTDADTVIDWAIAAVFEIAGFVVESERSYRARWAN